MKTRLDSHGMRSLTAALLLLGGLSLAACNGTISSIGVPAASPWTHFETLFLSTHDDLTVITTGTGITASLTPAGWFAACNSDQGGFGTTCSNANCLPDPLAECQGGAAGGSTGVSFVTARLVYDLQIDLARPGFTAGGVEVESTAAGTMGAIAVNLDAGSNLNLSAGFAEGLVPKPPADPLFAFDDFGLLLMSPAWPAFGSGFVCRDGTTTSCNPGDSADNVQAACESGDDLIYRTDGNLGASAVQCGGVTVNINVNPPFDTVGSCISTLKAQRCSGLTGQARAACNHAQIGVCHASFNIPSHHT